MRLWLLIDILHLKFRWIGLSCSPDYEGRVFNQWPLHLDLCLFREDFPKSEGFIACSSHDRLSIRAHGKIENAQVVPCQGRELSHRWVFPNHDSIVWISMCADKFVVIFGKHKVANLTVSLNTLSFETMNGIPKSDASIGSSTAADQQTFLMRWPC